MPIQKVFSILIRVRNIVNSLTYSILYGCLIGMTFLVVIDTLSRTLFAFSIGGIPEACTYLLVVTGFLALGMTQSVKGHIEVTFLSDRFPKRMKYFTKQTINIFLILFSLLVIYGGTINALSALATGESNWFGTHILPVWVFRFVVPVGFGLVILQVLAAIPHTKKEADKQAENVDIDTV